jgi:predicted RND superfamily exporter protein
MRSDVIFTLLSSAALVSIVFYIGFRRIRPLLAIIHVLLLCCVVAVALGAAIFRDLNMITIGLCAILIGLGVDFGMMLYGIYQAERDAGHDHETAIAASLRHHGSGIVFGTLTTAAAFLALLHSDCTGFEQLGVLIALGILFAGFFMMTVFFVFIGKKHHQRKGDIFLTMGEGFVARALAHPRALFCFGAGVLGLLTAFAAAPIGRLQFEANPRSLEPRDSRAGHAMRTIQAKMPNVGEPLIALLETSDAQSFHDQWNRLQATWAPLVEQGRLRSIATPAPFALSPERVAANTERLRSTDLGATRTALQEGIAREGLNPESFATSFALLDSMTAVVAGDRGVLEWRERLPKASSWWFVLDHFFGTSPNLGVAYITPAKPLTNFEEKEELRKLVEVPGIETHISGWTYTLADLVPWAKGKLLELTALMIGFNILLLAFLYRSFFPLFILLLSLALSIGAMLASLKFAGVALNLFNVLAFPLVLGVGVDYGIYMVIAMRAPGDRQRSLSTIFKPVLLSGLTTTAGFASLITATNPALRGLGVVCAFGVGWCLFATFFFVLPAYLWRGVK